MVGKETLLFHWYSKTTYNLGKNSISKWLIICDRGSTCYDIWRRVLDVNWVGVAVLSVYRVNIVVLIFVYIIELHYVLYIDIIIYLLFLLSFNMIYRAQLDKSSGPLVHWWISFSRKLCLISIFGRQTHFWPLY